MRHSKKAINGIINYNNSTIQYEENNNRAYLVKLSDISTESVIHYIEKLAKEKQLGKIFCKLPENSISPFLEKGYQIEAQVPNFYHSEEKCIFASKFTNQQREFLSPEEIREIANNLELAKSNANFDDKEIDDSIRFKVLDKKELEKAALLYKSVFETYPFPIYDDSYIENKLEKIMYFGAFLNGRLIACSAAEMNLDENNVKMTDFVTDKEFYRDGVGSELLKIMERVMRTKGINTAYSITRAFSKVMNITFAKNGYQYSGTLKNDVNIAGKIESMNVWYKHL